MEFGKRYVNFIATTIKKKNGSIQLIESIFVNFLEVLKHHFVT